MPKTVQSVQTRIYKEDHAAAVTTIPTVRSSQGNEFFPPKTPASASPVSGSDGYLDLIDEHKQRKE
tara:strand:- start:606 stop:803 length:198 start_codon:yes stop_codon:yes gene_type:complete